MTGVDVEQLLHDVDGLLGLVRYRGVKPSDGVLGDVISRIRAVLREPHIADFVEDDWTLLHPVACRANLRCSIHEAVAAECRFIGHMPVGEPGSYVVTLGPDGPQYTQVRNDATSS